MTTLHIIQKGANTIMVFSIKCECGETAHWNNNKTVYECDKCEKTVDLFTTEKE